MLTQPAGSLPVRCFCTWLQHLVVVYKGQLKEAPRCKGVTELCVFQFVWEGVSERGRVYRRVCVCLCVEGGGHTSMQHACTNPLCCWTANIDTNAHTHACAHTHCVCVSHSHPHMHNRTPAYARVCAHATMRAPTQTLPITHPHLFRTHMHPYTRCAHLLHNCAGCHQLLWAALVGHGGFKQKQDGTHQ